MKKSRILTFLGAGSLISGLAIIPKPAEALGTTDFTLYMPPTPSVSVAIDSAQTGNNNIKQLGDVPSSASFYKTANINVNGVDSYAVSVFLDCSAVTDPTNKAKCESGNLLTSSGDALKSVDSAKTFGTMNNEWGFRYNISDGVVDPRDKYFMSLPTSKETGFLQLNGEEQIKTDTLTSSDHKVITLGFGAKVDGDTAAGTYNGKVTVAVVASPVDAVFGGITTMQAMDHTICAAADIHDTAYLKDERDNKYYWVTKLEDGHCWMSQNLDLDIYANESDNSVYAGSTLSSTGVKLTKGNTDITDDMLSTTKMPKSTTQDISIEGANVNTGDDSKNSWDQGLWVKNDPEASDLCNHNNVGISNCTTQFTDVSDSEWTAAEDPNFTNLSSYKQGDTTHTKIAGSSVDTDNHIYDAHYLIGNYYQFNTATAGSGDGLTNADAPDSICPEDWKLPSSNTTDDTPGRGNFYYMLNLYNIATDINMGQLSGTLNGKTTDIALSPLFHVRSGAINSNQTDKFRFAGQSGHGWSSRTNTNDSDKAHYLYFSSRGVYPSYNADRYIGFPIRCVMY